MACMYSVRLSSTGTYPECNILNPSYTYMDAYGVGIAWGGKGYFYWARPGLVCNIPKGGDGNEEKEHISVVYLPMPRYIVHAGKGN
jgi:hypothetical protein